MELSGLYFHNAECGHGYGIEAINSEDAYNKLDAYFNNHRSFRWFRQGDSNFDGKQNRRDWLFIEFLGMDFNESSAIDFCDMIAKDIGLELKIY